MTYQKLHYSLKRPLICKRFVRNGPLKFITRPIHGYLFIAKIYLISEFEVAKIAKIKIIACKAHVMVKIMFISRSSLNA